MTEKVHVVELGRGYRAYEAEIERAVTRVLASGWYILGQEVEAFEAGFARWCEASHCIGVGNGTDAIAIALRALGVGPGDAVFTVSHTAVATVAAIELAGAEPVLVDVEADTYTMDPVGLEAAIVAQLGRSPRPKAVVAVHLYGQSCDLLSLRSLCDAHGLYLVEDCAQAHGTRFDGRHVGNFGQVGTFSFYPTKTLGAFGDGGAIVTQDSELAKRCRALRQYGWQRHYVSESPGMNSRLDELQAAILSVRLRHLDAELSRRRAIAAHYSRELCEVVNVPTLRANSDHSFHLYVVRTSRRDKLAAFLKQDGILSNVHYPVPIHLQPAYSGRVTLAPGGLPVTEEICGEILTLPLHPFLEDAERRRVIEGVLRAYVAG
jgi:dTDP-4-amino-4,6-dideoxygalactose transaminase